MRKALTLSKYGDRVGPGQMKVDRLDLINLHSEENGMFIQNTQHNYASVM